MNSNQTIPLQLPLAIRTSDLSDLTDFYVGDNDELIQYLSTFGEHPDQFIYIWGHHGVGVSFLLQAMANQYKSPYISLKQIPDISPDILNGLSDFPLVCLDDIDAVSGRAGWQTALFHLFNDSRSKGNRVIFGNHTSPAQADISLEDLKSRLFWGQCYQVYALTDNQKQLALIERAASKGLLLETLTAQFLLSHYDRDMQAQFQLLEQLDHASMTHKRKLTIPFIKDTLNA